MPKPTKNRHSFAVLADQPRPCTADTTKERLVERVVECTVQMPATTCGSLAEFLRAVRCWPYSTCGNLHAIFDEYVHGDCLHPTHLIRDANREVNAALAARAVRAKSSNPPVECACEGCRCNRDAAVENKGGDVQEDASPGPQLTPVPPCDDEALWWKDVRLGGGLTIDLAIGETPHRAAMLSDDTDGRSEIVVRCVLDVDRARPVLFSTSPAHDAAAVHPHRTGLHVGRRIVVHGREEGRVEHSAAKAPTGARL